MPVLLDESEIDTWLNVDKYKFEKIFEKDIMDEKKEKWKKIQFYPIGPYVNDIKNKTAQCLMTLEEHRKKLDEVGIKRFFGAKQPKEKVKPEDSNLTQTSETAKPENEKEKAKMNITPQYELKVIDEESKEDSSHLTPLHEKFQNSNSVTDKGDSNSQLESAKVKDVDDSTNSLKRKRDQMTKPEEKPASLKKVKLTPDDPNQAKLSFKKVSMEKALKLAFPSPQK